MANSDVQNYLNQFEESIKNRLMAIINHMQKWHPDILPIISYGIIAYKWKGKPLVYFGGFKNHIGMYATPGGHEAFKQALQIYKQGKGSVQFPHQDALPWQLMKELVEYRKNQIQSQFEQNQTDSLGKMQT